MIPILHYLFKFSLLTIVLYLFMWYCFWSPVFFFSEIHLVILDCTLIFIGDLWWSVTTKGWYSFHAPRWNLVRGRHIIHSQFPQKWLDTKRMVRRYFSLCGMLCFCACVCLHYGALTPLVLYVWCLWQNPLVFFMGLWSLWLYTDGIYDNIPDSLTPL